MHLQKRTKIEIGICCLGLGIPIPFVAIYEGIRHHKNKKDKIILKNDADDKLGTRDFNRSYFEKFTKNTLNEARLRLNDEVVNALRDIKTRTFEKIYELQKRPMRDEEKDTLTKDFLQSEIKKDPILKDYLDDGLINADFIAMHGNLLKNKAQKTLNFFKKNIIKAYLLYNDDINNPIFTLIPIQFKNEIYITKDTKELFLLDKTIGTYLGAPLYYVVHGIPFSMEMEHGIEQLESEFEGVSNSDKRFVIKRKGFTPGDIEKKFKSIELNNELGYTFPLVKTLGIVVITAIMSVIVTSMLWMLTLI